MDLDLACLQQLIKGALHVSDRYGRAVRRTISADKHIGVSKVQYSVRPTS
jgi:hypothetical protein